MPKCVEVLSIACNTITIGLGLAFVGLSSFILVKHYDNEIIISPVIVEAFVALSFGCLLLLTEIVINSLWGSMTEYSGHRQSKQYKWMFIIGAAWKTIVLIVQLTVGCLLFSPSSMQAQINATMFVAFDAYDPAQPSTVEHVDHFQQELQCCGVEEYQYWFDQLGGKDVTPGCCKNITEVTCYKDIEYADITTVQSKIYTEGCYDAYTYSMEGSSLVASIIFFCTAVALASAVVSYIINVVMSSKFHDDTTDGMYTANFDKPVDGENKNLMGHGGEEFPMQPSYK